MKSWRLAVAVLLSTALSSISAQTDDVADVKTAEAAFNAAQNAGNIAGMMKHFLPGRTIYGPNAGGLGVGWTENPGATSSRVRCGKEDRLRIENLDVRLYAETAKCAALDSLATGLDCAHVGTRARCRWTVAIPSSRCSLPATQGPTLGLHRCALGVQWRRSPALPRPCACSTRFRHSRDADLVPEGKPVFRLRRVRPLRPRSHAARRRREEAACRRNGIARPRRKRSDEVAHRRRATGTCVELLEFGPDSLHRKVMEAWN